MSVDAPDGARASAAWTPPPGTRLAEFSEMRRAILAILKRQGAMSIAELADELRVSYEAVRQQVAQLRRERWIDKRSEHRPKRGAGRPKALYRLTAAGDHLFPKHYDLLSIELIDALIERFGLEGLRRVLKDLTDSRVGEWAPRLAGLSLEEKIHALTGIYLAEDPFMAAETGDDGELRLIEHNCPFLNVAEKRPALCSLTVSTLTRLLGYRVVREERFQWGDGRCVFRLQRHRPVSPDDPGFHFEDA